jgi:pSer/pThr/pTyr-binding forkhead associated (FHA) protein
MTAFLEVWRPAGADLVPLGGDRITVGRAAGNDIVLGDDGQVSRVHAVLERLGGGWSIRDVSSRNGTFVNGNRVSGEARVGPGDELRIGRTRIVLRGSPSAGKPPATEATVLPPQLTPRERDVFALVVAGRMNKEIAAQLGTAEQTVKQHRGRVMEKLGLHSVADLVRFAERLDTPT